MGFKTTLYRGDRIELNADNQQETVVIDVCDILINGHRNHREQVRIDIQAPNNIRIRKTKTPKPKR